MYTNDQMQIRSGLVNYIGALMQSSVDDAPTSKQQVISILIEEAIKLSQDEDSLCDMHAIKPILRSVTFIFEQRKKALSELPQDKFILDTLERYDNIIRDLNVVLSVI